MSITVIALITLAVSMIILYYGLAGMFGFIANVIGFWARVIWKNPPEISINITPHGLAHVAFLIGLAGFLWSIITLAIIASRVV